MLGWSLAFAAFSFAVGYVQARQMVNNDTASFSQRRTNSSTTSSVAPPQFDIDKYFVSDKIDPNMEFDIVENVRIGDTVLKMPVPRGATFECIPESNEGEDKTIYSACFKKDGRLFMVCYFQDIENTSRAYDVLTLKKNAFLINMNHQEYRDNLLTMFKRVGFSSILENPYIEQNTLNSFIIYSILALSKDQSENPTRSAKIGIPNGALVLNNIYIAFIGSANELSGTDNKILFITWMNKFIEMNS